MSSESVLIFSEARLREQSADRLRRYHQAPSLARERLHFRHFCSVDLAHTVMLIEQGIIRPNDGAILLKELSLIEQNGYDALEIDLARGSLLLQIEHHLTRRVGEEVAGQLHTARSRIDQSATVWRLQLREGLISVLKRLSALRQVLVELAASHSLTLMPSYTHMQQSQPGVFGHYVLGFEDRFRDDFKKGVEVYARTNRNPLGCVGLSGTTWPIDRDRTTSLLGFSAVVENSRVGREVFYAAEIMASLSIIMSNLNDLATDLHVWSTSEFAMVQLDDSYCSTSSIFPQKKNPTALETVKTAAGLSVTWLASMLSAFRGEGTGDQAVRGVSLADDAIDITVNMIDLMVGVMQTITVKILRMRQLTEDSWATSSNLADAIVRNTSLSYRQAHHVVGRLVRKAIETDTSPRNVTAELVNEAAIEISGAELRLNQDTILHALNPLNFVNDIKSRGGVSPAEVRRMTREASAILDNDDKWLNGEESRTRDREVALWKAANALMGG